MQTKKYTTIDRHAAGWLPGPWDQEPEDKVQWQDKKTGLPCLAVRNNFGSWCGYVGVSPGHPCYAESYHDVDVDVHGGLTFSDFCQPGQPEEEGICHVPAPDEEDHIYWLGFDCHHHMDLAPGDAHMGELLRRLSQDTRNMTTYKTLAYVQEECRKLAAQLVMLAKK